MLQNTLLSNVAAISEMLEQVELREAETKIVVSEASQAGNDILVEAAKMKEMSTLAMEANNKVFLKSVTVDTLFSASLLKPPVSRTFHWYICRLQQRFSLRNLFWHQKLRGSSLG
jgi:hypothetical protein